MFSGFDITTWIDTSEGVQRIADLRLGDSVRTESGFDTITHLETRTCSDVVSIDLASSCGNKIICSSNYLLPIVRFSRSKNDRVTFQNHLIENVPAQIVQVNDFLYMPVRYHDQGESALTDLTRLRLWYTCEGAKNGNGAIVIGQSKEKNPDKYAEIKHLIEKCGWKAWCSFDRIAFTELAAAEFNDLGGYAHNKRLPCEVFTGSDDAVNEALRILIQADGSSRDRDNYFFSKSLQMAQEVIALAIRVGRPATIQRVGHTGVHDVHIPAINPIKPRYRFGEGQFRMVKVKQVASISEDHEIVQLKCERSNTVVGGTRGLMVLSA